jgi:GNAT superfamily N-acetyltransferase
MTRMVHIADATPERWDDLVAIMGTRGDPPRCWCQWFRLLRPEFGATTIEQRREAMRCQLADPVPPGVLAYDDSGAPAGWCAIAPRADYRRLTKYRAAATDDVDGLWSVTCFVVRVGARRQGLAADLLDGALDLAHRYGATAVEAYPVDTSVRAASSAELYHGPLSIFLRAGFHETGTRTTSARPVVGRTL